MSVFEQIKSASRPEVLYCEKHGHYHGWVATILGEEIPSECDACAKEQHARELDAINAAQREREASAGFCFACIPPRFQDKTFGNYKEVCAAAKDVVLFAKDYVINFNSILDNGRSFLFTGNTGTGKTHIACAITNNIIRRGYTATYVSSLNFISRMKKAWSNFNEETEDDIIEAMMKFDLLVIDELGKGELGPKERGMIFRLIDRRTEEKKPVIGISKYSEEKLKLMIDDDVVRRLKAGGGKAILFNWPTFEEK